MFKNLQFARAALLTSLLVVGTSLSSIAATYTATTSGNWSSSVTWGGTAPGFNITSSDNVVIPVGVTVTLDNNLTVNNAAASVSVVGSLTGTTAFNLTSGTLSGNGSVALSTLTVGTGGYVTSLGTISVSQFANSQAALALSGVMSVSNMVVLTAGNLQLNSGSSLNLASNATVNMAGGTYSSVGGLLNLAGSYNLLYTGSVSSIGLESALTGLQNVTVNLASTTNQLSMTGNLVVTGVLSLQQGVLNMAGNTLTIVGGVTTTAGTIAGTPTSNLVVNGTGSVGTIAFAASSHAINNLTLGITGSGSVSLASDLIVNGITTLTSGSLNLNGHNLTIGGTIAAAGLGTFSGSSTSSITISGTGAAGTLAFSPSANTLGSLTVNTTGTSGTVSLGSGLTVSNALNMTNGTLSLNGQSLTINGAINTFGTSSISGSALSNITFNGTANAGLIVFTPGTLTQSINNLTVNLGSTGYVALGSALTVGGTLTLAQGNINIGKNDLTIAATGSLVGGSSASYVITSDTGSLIMTVANLGATGMYQVGTVTDYAPVTVTNNSTLAGSFNVAARQGVLAQGTTGYNLATHQSAVNTSWEVSSSIVTGALVNLEMFWTTAMQVNAFDNTQAFVSHYTAGAWNTHALAAATTHGAGSFSMALTGVTSFSPFAIFDRSTSTGITSITSSDVLQIYPNPTTDKLTIQTSATDKSNVEISDLSGKVIGQYSISGTDNTINVSDLSTGSYFIKVSNNQSNTVKKFVKI